MNIIQLMSKSRFIVPAAIIAGLATVLFVLHLAGESGSGVERSEEAGTSKGIVPQNGIRVPVESSAGVEHGIEDPQGRAYFEWLRLHNPETRQIPVGIRAKEHSFAKSIPTREFLSLGKNGKPPLDWTARGPIRIGGRTRALGIDLRNPDVINAGGVSGGMWHSEDGGQTWTKATRPDQHHSVTTVVQDPRPGHEDEWYYGSGEFIGNSANAPGAPYMGVGLYKSTDNGQTWEVTGFDAAGASPTFNVAYDVFFNLAIDPSNTSQLELYAATYGLIYKWDGVTREPRLLDSQQDPTFSSFSDVAVTDDGVVYAALSSDGGRPGLWRSTNGDDWTDITPSGWPTVFERTVISVAPSNQNIVYFLGRTPGTGATEHSLWRYNAATGSWDNRTESLPTSEQFPVPDNFPDNLGAFNSQGGYDLIIAVKPDNPDVVFIGGTNLYRSTDGFSTAEQTAWIGGYHPQHFIYPNHHPDLHAIEFNPENPNQMLSGTDGGVARTTNNLATNVSWTSLNDGYRTTQFYSVAVDESAPGNDIVVGGMQDNGTVFTNEKTGSQPWVGDIFGGDGAFADIADGQEHFYVSAQNAQIYRLDIDQQGNVQQVTRVDPTEAEFGAGLFVTPFHLDPNDQAVMYLGGGTSLYRNENLLEIPDGNRDETNLNWTEFENTGGEGEVITAVQPTAMTASSTRVYYATFNGAAGSSGIFRLDDAQTGEPQPVDITLRSGPDPMPQGAYVSSIAVHPNDPNTVIACFSNYGVRSLFYSEDAGATWTYVAGNLEEEPDGTGGGPSTRWVQILPVTGGAMYLVGTSTGLYSTTELSGSSTTWIQEGAESIGNVVVDMIDIRPADNLVVAATHGNGIYSATADVNVATGEPIDPGEAFSITHPYPNPFQVLTRFVLRVAHEQQVEIELYDMLGQRVEVIFEGVLAANEPHAFEIDAGILSSGVYAILVDGERFSESRSVVLAR